MNEFIVLRNLKKQFGDRVLYRNLSYAFPRRGFYVIVGPSGCGKSTLLELIAGLDTVYDGTILFDGVPLRGKSESYRGRHRLRDIGYLRQGYDLLELETAVGNAGIPLRATSAEKPNLQERKAKDYLTRFGLKKKVSSTANRLSGGEKQRVALSRSLVNEPRVLLCDEPTGALDAKNGKMIFEYLRAVSKNTLVIMVTHDEEEARKWGDVLLRMKGGELKEERLHPIVDPKPIHTIKSRKRKKRNGIPFQFWLKHAFHLCKEKKRRTFLALSILSFSFASLGTAVYLGKDIGKEIDRSFAALIGSGSIVMNRKGADGNAIGRVVPSSLSSVYTLRNLTTEIADYGVFYPIDYDGFFSDRDSVTVDIGSGKYAIPGLSIRSVNESLWLDDYPDLDCYPSHPPIMEEDQIVLGLPYAAMFQLCFRLHILRDYEHLGDYVAENGLQLVFSVANENWTYDDEQTLSVVAVARSEVSTIYTYEHRLAETVYEKWMRFPAMAEPDGTYPWIMQKLYYVKPKTSGTALMEDLRKTKVGERYLLEADSHRYDRSHCSVGKTCGTGRYYVYEAEKSSLSFSDVSAICESYGFPNHLIGSSFTYVSYPSAMMTGFANPFFASPSHEDIEQTIDAVTSLSSGDIHLLTSFPDSVVRGHYTIPYANALTCSNDFGQLIEGRIPRLLTEVVISSFLKKKWNNPKTIFLSGLAETDGISNDYRMAEVSVVGVCDSEQARLYVPSCWPLDFFRDELGASSLLLEPTCAIFEREGNRGEWIRNLSLAYPGYDFADPSSRVSNSTEQVVDYLKTSLSLVSVSCLVLAFLLLSAIILLTVMENRREGFILYNLGFSRTQIAKSLHAIAVILSLPSFFLGGGFVAGLEYILHREIGKNFGTETRFVFSYEPLIVLAITFAIAFSIIAVILDRFVAKRDFAKEK